MAQGGAARVVESSPPLQSMEIQSAMKTALQSAVQSGAKDVAELSPPPTEPINIENGVQGVATRVAELSPPASATFDEGAFGAETLGNTVQSGAARAAETSLPDVAPVLPKLNFEVPTLPQVKLPPPPHLPEVNIQPPSLPPNNVVEGADLALKHAGDASLSDIGNGVVHSLQFVGEGIVHSVQFMGGILVKILDLILGAAAGTSVAALLADVQSSVTSTVNGATHAVASTIDSIANMSIKEILQHLVALIIAVTDVLMKIANAAVYLLSGRDGADWALQASTSAHDASSRLLARATETYDEATRESLAQLAHGIGDYSRHVGDELLALVGNLNGAATGAVDGMSSLGLDADALDNVATAVQTAFTL